MHGTPVEFIKIHLQEGRRKIAIRLFTRDCSFGRGSKQIMSKGLEKTPQGRPSGRYASVNKGSVALQRV